MKNDMLVVEVRVQIYFQFLQVPQGPFFAPSILHGSFTSLVIHTLELNQTKYILHNFTNKNAKLYKLLRKKLLIENCIDGVLIY